MWRDGVKIENNLIINFISYTVIPNKSCTGKPRRSYNYLGVIGKSEKNIYIVAVRTFMLDISIKGVRVQIFLGKKLMKEVNNNLSVEMELKADYCNASGISRER